MIFETILQVEDQASGKIVMERGCVIEGEFETNNTFKMKNINQMSLAGIPPGTYRFKVVFLDGSHYYLN